MKTGKVHVNEEREKVSQVNSSSNAEPGYSEKPHNKDLINSISALTNTRLTEFRSEMITLINKNGDQLMLLGHVSFSMNNMRRDRIAGKKICTPHVKQVILPSLCFHGMTTQRKFVKQRSHQNLPKLKPTHSTTTIHRISKPERGQQSKK